MQNRVERLTNLEVSVSAYKRDSEIGGGTRFVGVIESNQKCKYKTVSPPRAEECLAEMKP